MLLTPDSCRIEVYYLLEFFIEIPFSIHLIFSSPFPSFFLSTLVSNHTYSLILTFKDFKVGNLLGKGSFAGVYRAESIHTGLEVAIKMVRIY